jgi:hypothetical protein
MSFQEIDLIWNKVIDHKTLHDDELGAWQAVQDLYINRHTVCDVQFTLGEIFVWFIFDFKEKKLQFLVHNVVKKMKFCDTNVWENLNIKGLRTYKESNIVEIPIDESNMLEMAQSIVNMLFMAFGNDFMCKPLSLPSDIHVTSVHNDKHLIKFAEDSKYRQAALKKLIELQNVKIREILTMNQ